MLWLGVDIGKRSAERKRQGGAGAGGEKDINGWLQREDEEAETI